MNVDPRRARRALIGLLRLVGCFDLLALGAMVMPWRWMEAVHAWLGMGSLPDAAVVEYLARSTSFLYGMHAAMVLFISFDVERYWRLITFLGAAAIVAGVAVLAIDVAVGMPLLWTLGEGPCYLVLGLLVLALQRMAQRGGGGAAAGGAPIAESRRGELQ